MKILVLLLSVLLLAAPVEAEEFILEKWPHPKMPMLVPREENRPIDLLLCEDIAWREYPAQSGESPYGKYISWTVYQREMFQEMCLAWYLMQQPKNHGILSSHGAPNF